jgi:hypothetical protein
MDIMTDQPRLNYEPRSGDADFVKVASAQNQAEAEFIQGLLREEGVPSILRRTSGFDVPDFLAAGPREVLVRVSSVQDARDILLLSDLGPVVPAPEAIDTRRHVPSRLLAGLALLAIMAWCATELLT